MTMDRFVGGMLVMLCMNHGIVMADSVGRMPMHVPPAYKAECGSCHTAYPPGMLPAASWNRVMTGLENHYGVDATLEPSVVMQLSQWLETNAGHGRKTAVAPPEDRITRSQWFVKEHRKVETAVWRLSSVKSPSNCSACHNSADQGRFSEHDLKRPAGLTATQAKAWEDD